MQRFAASLFALLLTTQFTALAWAEPILTATCNEPKGSRFDLKKGKINSSADGFSGIHPVFIIDKDKPSKLLVVWGAAKLKGIELATNAKEIDIVSATDNQITAIEVDPTGDAVLMYSLFPQSGLIYFTQHRYQLLEGGNPNSASYHSKCNFSTK